MLLRPGSPPRRIGNFPSTRSSSSMAAPRSSPSRAIQEKQPAVPSPRSRGRQRVLPAVEPSGGAPPRDPPRPDYQLKMMIWSDRRQGGKQIGKAPYNTSSGSMHCFDQAHLSNKFMADENGMQKAVGRSQARCLRLLLYRNISNCRSHASRSRKGRTEQRRSVVLRRILHLAVADCSYARSRVGKQPFGYSE